MEKSKSLSKNHNTKNKKKKVIYQKSGNHNECKKKYKKKCKSIDISIKHKKNIISEDEKEKIELNEIKSPSSEEVVPLTDEELNYYTTEFTKLLYVDKISEDNLDKDSQLPIIKIINEIKQYENRKKNNITLAEKKIIFKEDGYNSHEDNSYTNNIASNEEINIKIENKKKKKKNNIFSLITTKIIKTILILMIQWKIM